MQGRLPLWGKQAGNVSPVDKRLMGKTATPADLRRHCCAAGMPGSNPLWQRICLASKRLAAAATVYCTHQIVYRINKSRKPALFGLAALKYLFAQTRRCWSYCLIALLFGQPGAARTDEQSCWRRRLPLLSTLPIYPFVPAYENN